MERFQPENKSKKEKMNGALKLVKEHIRYFAAGALFLTLVLVLVNCAGPKEPQDGENPDAAGAGPAGPQQVTEQAYEVDAHQDVNELITRYYTAYAAGDVATISTIASPVTANEQSYITMFSQYVEEYRNISCYTKSGLTEGSYLVSVSLEIKFAGVETPAPGLDFFYVQTNDQGALYIDNLYSQYNLASKENALDTGVHSLISDFENDADFLSLQSEVKTKYDTAVSADPNLATMMQTTVPGAIDGWKTQIAANPPAAVPETPPVSTEQPAEPDASQEVPAEGAPETPTQTEPPAQTETLATTDRVNVRAGADTTTDVLGTVEKGTIVTRTGVSGDWSVIDYNGQTGYIKNEFLTYDTASVTADTGNDTADAGDSDTATNHAEGTVITLSDTVNIRSSMSETASKVGTAYTGEQVTVVMSYAEGWTKVTYNGQTGYIKSSLLK